MIIIKSIKFLLICWILIFENHSSLRFLVPLWFDYICKFFFFYLFSRFTILRILSAFSVWTFFVYFLKQPLQIKILCTGFLPVHRYTNFRYRYFSAIYRVSRKMKQKMQGCTLLMTSFLHWKILTMFMANSCKIVNRSKNMLGMLLLFIFN